MRGEKEKMLAGEWFDPHDAELTADRDRATRLMHRLNVECCGHGDDYRTTLGELCPNVRGFIREPFHCDYGYNIHMGEGSFVNFDCVFLDLAPIRIGCGTLIGPKVQLLTAHHPFDAATRGTALEAGKPIVIGDHCWLGGGVIVCPGVTIGDVAIVAAYSVVTKDVEPYSVVGGNPAHFIKKRFDDELISLLLQWKWWDLEGDELFENLSILVNPDLGNVRLQIRALLAK